MLAVRKGFEACLAAAEALWRTIIARRGTSERFLLALILVCGVSTSADDTLLHMGQMRRADQASEEQAAQKAWRSAKQDYQTAQKKMSDAQEQLAHAQQALETAEARKKASATALSEADQQLELLWKQHEKPVPAQQRPLFLQ